MFHKRNMALSAVLGLSMLAFGSPSYAFDFESLLRNYLGGTLGTVTSDQANLKTSINTRQAQLEADIQAGAKSGQLTPQEETDLLHQLNHVALLEGTALADGNLSIAETNNIVDELTNVSGRLHTYLTNSSVTGYAATSVSLPASTRWTQWSRRYTGTGSGDTAISNQLAVQAIIDTHQAQLDASIEQGLVNGTLTWQDSHALRTEVSKVNADETTFLADGKLSFTEQQQLTDQLASIDALLKARTTLPVAYSRPGNGHGHAYGRRRGGNRYGSPLLRRIEAGVTSGRLTRKEADRLVRLESQALDIDRQLRSTGARISYQEESRLLGMRDRLTARINATLSAKDIY